MTAWISTDKQLPEDEQLVLGYWPATGDMPHSAESLTYHAWDAPDGPACWIDHWGDKRDPPVFWQPLVGPEPRIGESIKRMLADPQVDAAMRRLSSK